MTKADLVEAVREGAGIGKGQAEEAVQAFLGAITKSLKKGEKLTLTGFGTFSVSNRKARTGRNPRPERPSRSAPGSQVHRAVPEGSGRGKKK